MKKSLSLRAHLLTVSSLACLVFSLVAIVAMPADVFADGRLAPAGVSAESNSNSMAANAPSANMPYGAQSYDQSAFAMGTMRWNVVFVQGVGGTENWTAAEISNAQTKITTAKNFWQGLTSSFVQNAQLKIDINYANSASPIVTAYEPSQDESETWINQAMEKLGYNSSTDQYTNVRNFNQAQRNAAGDNWATTIFMVHNTNKGATSYAYAYYGGPFTIIENNSAGWGPANINMVLSHEMGHIFFANDEYYASGATIADHGGYLNQANLNAERNADGTRKTALQPNALMLNNGNSSTHVPYSPSPSSSQQYGFRDTDGDHIPDILDVAPTLTGNTSGSNPVTRLFHFSGSLAVTTIDNQDPLNVGFSNSQSDMTIDKIQSAYYKLDHGPAVALTAVDGIFDGYTESLDFSIFGLAVGQHTIDVYGISNMGIQSSVLEYQFTAVPEPSTFTLLGLGAGIAGVIAYRRKKK